MTTEQKPSPEQWHEHQHEMAILRIQRAELVEALRPLVNGTYYITHEHIETARALLAKLDTE